MTLETSTGRRADSSWRIALRPQKLLVLDDGGRDARDLERPSQVFQLSFEAVDPIADRR